MKTKEATETLRKDCKNDFFIKMQRKCHRQLNAENVFICNTMTFIDDIHHILRDIKHPEANFTISDIDIGWQDDKLILTHVPTDYIFEIHPSDFIVYENDVIVYRMSAIKEIRSVIKRKSLWINYMNRAKTEQNSSNLH